jgi:hypothetical protein
MINISNLGTTNENIAKAEAKLKTKFPDGLKQIWQISNGLELVGGWRFFPVFDPKEPRKTCNDIVYENTKARWSYMDENLIAIAGGDTGNQLVLKKTENKLDSVVYLWNHETNKIKKWGKDLSYILSKAKNRIGKIERQILKSKGERA